MNGVTSIGNNAFENCTSMTSITIMNGVTSIGYGAFNNCSSLTNITIPDSVISIGEGAFGSCDCLTSIVVNSGNTAYSSVDGVLFNKSKTTIIACPCGLADNYTIPSSVISISKYAFYNCKSLTSITIPDGVTSISYFAFFNCTSLKNITIPDSVISIEHYAFQNCTSMTSITIPDGVTSIGVAAFAYCQSITEVFYNGTQSEWSMISIASYNECLTNANIHFISITTPDLVLPISLTTIESEAFVNLPNIHVIRIPACVTSIAQDAFDPGVTLLVPTSAWGEWAETNGYLWEVYTD